MSGFRQKGLKRAAATFVNEASLEHIEAGFRGLWQIVLSGCASE
jgi:hypothetical protein